jgi:hypothetical protein
VSLPELSECGLGSFKLGALNMFGVEDWRARCPSSKHALRAEDARYDGIIGVLLAIVLLAIRRRWDESDGSFYKPLQGGLAGVPGCHGCCFSHMGALFLHGAHLRYSFHCLPFEPALADALLSNTFLCGLGSA